VVPLTKAGREKGRGNLTAFFHYVKALFVAVGQISNARQLTDESIGEFFTVGFVRVA
jgi:hypothetical protein